MAILVKVSGLSLGKLFILDFFISNKKNRHQEHKGFDMIFMCVIKKCDTAIFGQRRWHQTATALSIPKANKLSILYQGAF